MIVFIQEGQVIYKICMSPKKQYSTGKSGALFPADPLEETRAVDLHNVVYTILEF